MLYKNPLPRNRLARVAGALALGMLALSVQAQSKPADARQNVLKVCQDPNNLPMSNKAAQGYENKIAALFAEKLGWKLEHAWHPQRMGYLRQTLQAKVADTDAYVCDVVTGVSSNFERGLATKPYYTSTYALAYVKGKQLDSVHAPEDLLKLDPAVLEKLRIGIFTGTPAADWLVKNHLTKQMVSYQLMTGDADQYPGQIIEHDLANGKIDVAIAWGPIVGYFAKHADGGVPIEVVPFKAKADGVRYGFSISMGVRRADKDLRDQLDQLIESNQSEIDAILTDYGVPLVKESAEPKS
jgi:quinoprotein dehydrogenase-associated probable ABC transporter substrate-binding protein